jgi:sulfide:quinone oxidoreductase
MNEDTRHHVVIAGAGVAGLEALIGLSHLAADRVRITLLAPTDEFLFRALSVKDPFALPGPHAYPLDRICDDHGAELVRGALAAVDPETHTLVTDDGLRLGYDSLLVAVGAHASPAFEDGLTFRGMQDAEAMHGLVQDVEAGYVTSVAFVVPPGTTWPLPLYELALMTAERAYGMGMDALFTIVTPESQPLAVFGREASEHVDATLAERGIVMRTDAHVSSVEGGTVVAAPGGVEVKAQRVVVLPRLTGPSLSGLPCDPHGFLPVDEHGRVRDTPDVYGAGDGTNVPIKQGGIAAQQADAAIRSIAAHAGADVSPRPFRPVLRAQLLTGARSTYLRQAVAGGAGEQASEASDAALWWPPTKVAAPFLAPYLDRVDRRTTSAAGV